MDRSGNHLKRPPIAGLLFLPALLAWGVLVVAGVTGNILLAQTTSDLSDPKLKANANIPQHNSHSMRLVDSLVNARELAALKSVPWKGLRIVGTDEVPASPNGPLATELLPVYQKQACQADAIVVGHATSSQYHLSGYGTSIYGDYIFVVDLLLKDNRAAPIRSRREIVVTRPGGSLSLPEGPLNFEDPEFPRLQSGTTYLQFLRYIPESTAYHALDSLSTLVADGNNWLIARKALSHVVIKGFTRGVLEPTIGHWLAPCSR